MEESSTAVNCEKEGHCWHGGTAVGSRYCCKCGKTWYPTITNYYPQERVSKIPNIRKLP